MPPATTADNGGFAFLVTIRPRDYSLELEEKVKKYILEKVQPDWHLGVREKSNHSHWTLFLHDGEQRSNLITKFLNNPLKDLADDEKSLFRRYDRNLKTGAVVNLTTLGAVAEYLSGEFDKKIDDDFEVISEKLPEPDDISELEEYLPATNGLKRKRQCSVWYACAAEKYKGPKPCAESDVLGYLNTRMYVEKDLDIIPDMRILKQKTVALVRYINSEGSPTYNDATLLDCEHQLAGRKRYAALSAHRDYMPFA